ncbi:AzlD domain-containing protein [Desulfoluna spongiiphila]|uniref:Branched-chain amino acid transport protein n=1 Tax=Desulfoluna spongiiphila TaxID=419481 RepID=A0A1G5H2Z8_9BACT|nr:AzlD domain-containing protein [Desulfoluna spongiiphila]SCY58252.1 Branched-chain amino acid transport protein [Desulfoluna spongiiphila]VVS94763.1 branched-chain amino acid transport azld [Desulfoluna spongiiphila]
MSHDAFFVVALLCGAVTFSERGAFLLRQRGKEPHPRLARALRLVPAAVLPALVTPAIFMHSGAVDLSFGNLRLLAGAVALAVALWKRSVFLTLASGLSSLWILQWAVGG